MAKKKEVLDTIDMIEGDEIEVTPSIDPFTNEMYTENREAIYRDQSPKIKNCLRRQTIKVSYIKKDTPLIRDKKHILYGGKASKAYVYLCVPLLSNGNYKNVLTNEEKDYLEYIMGLPHNALSIYRKENNFWDNYRIRLTTEGLRLRLDNPEDYIKYKVLLANTTKVCPSRSEWERRPKSEYDFLIEDEQEAVKADAEIVDVTAMAYSLFLKYSDDYATLSTILSIISMSSVDKGTTIEFIKTRLHEYIQKDAKRFVSIAKDQYLVYKVLVRKAHVYGLLKNKGGLYYLKDDGSPLATKGLEPDITNASVFLSLPENSELKFRLEAEINRIDESNRFK